MNQHCQRAYSAGAIFVLGISSPVLAQSPRYRAIPLESSEFGAWPTCINNRGWVGGRLIGPPETAGSTAVIFADAGEYLIFPLEPGVSGTVADLNDRGDAVGDRGVYLDELPVLRTAFAVIDAEVIELPAGSFESVSPNAINNRREIVGSGSSYSDERFAAIGWKITPTGPVDLPIDYQLVSGSDINDKGDIAGGGMMWCSRSFGHRASAGWNVYWAAVQRNGTLTRLTSPVCESTTSVSSMNERGQMLQTESPTVSPDIDATTWLWSADGSRINLGIPGFNTIATAINESSVLVGYRYDESDTDALVWFDNVPAVLSDITLDAGEFDIRSGRAINDVNQIAALVRRYDSFNVYHAVLLTPLDLTLAAPLPGIAGTRNSLYLAGATQGQDVLFFYAASPGSTALPGCDNLFLDLADPILIGRDDASPTTNAWLDVDIPAAARGRTLYLQAFEPSTCRISNRVEVMLR